MCGSNNYLCSKCGLVFIPRNRQRVFQYYKEDGYFKKSPNLACKKQFISKSLLATEGQERVNSALKIFSINPKGKKVLDIGCGYGEILSCFKKTGSKVMGIEASATAAGIGKKIFSIPIEPVLLEEFNPKSKFDIIWCSHVLEHIADPNSFLQKIKVLLKTNGHLYLEVPNILKPSGGFSLDMFLYEEHLQTFSVYNLYLILKKHGFRTVACSDSGFLKFWCSLSNKKELKIPKITSKEILSFLEKYKKGYSLVDLIKVYSQKGLYGLKLIFYKARDVF